MFNLESDFVNEFQITLDDFNTPFSIKNYACEFNYLSGRIDIIATNKNKYLYAFEVKLSKWKDALQQAYRNSSFTHFSYVLLPSYSLKNALKFEEEFKIRRIGLCTVINFQLTIVIKAPRNKPIQPWLTSSALNYIYSK